MSFQSLDQLCEAHGMDRSRFPESDAWTAVFTQAVAIGPDADAWLTGMAELADVGWVVQSVSVVVDVEGEALLVGIARRLSDQQMAQMRGGPPGIVVPQPGPGSVSPLRPV